MERQCLSSWHMHNGTSPSTNSEKLKAVQCSEVAALSASIRECSVLCPACISCTLVAGERSFSDPVHALKDRCNGGPVSVLQAGTKGEPLHASQSHGAIVELAAAAQNTQLIPRCPDAIEGKRRPSLNTHRAVVYVQADQSGHTLATVGRQRLSRARRDKRARYRVRQARRAAPERWGKGGGGGV